MISVVLLGFGNVNYHLAHAFLASEKIDLKQIYNRSNIKLPETLKEVNFTTSIEHLQTADLYIIGIPDDRIGSFSATLPFKGALVVHTSGGASIAILNNKNRQGVFYPLQTFSKASEVDFSNIPICLEAPLLKDMELLKKVANTISEKIAEISSAERSKLHLSAVVVNNFVNHLYAVSEAYLKENTIDFDLLKPLILETAKKIQTLSPAQAQTGPAKRNDTKTIEKHLHLLTKKTDKEGYKLFTEAIKKSHEL